MLVFDGVDLLVVVFYRCYWSRHRYARQVALLLVEQKLFEWPTNGHSFETYLAISQEKFAGSSPCRLVADVNHGDVVSSLISVRPTATWTIHHAVVCEE